MTACGSAATLLAWAFIIDPVMLSLCTTVPRAWTLSEGAQGGGSTKGAAPFVLWSAVLLEVEHAMEEGHERPIIAWCSRQVAMSTGRERVCGALRVVRHCDAALLEY